MPGTPARAVLGQVVALALVPLLKPLGYRKAGPTFRRSVGRCVQVVNVQVDRWSRASALRLCLNLGVFYPEVHALETYLGWRPGTAGPHEYECQLRSRLGWLLPRKRDIWWQVRAGQDPARVADEVKRLMARHGLRWLERMADLDTAQRHAEGFHPIAFALAAGDRKGARKLFEEEIHAAERRTPKPWAPTLRRWGVQLGFLK